MATTFGSSESYKKTQERESAADNRPPPPTSIPPVEEAPPPADDTPEDSGLPNLPPLPDRTDIAVFKSGGTNVNTGQPDPGIDDGRSYNLNKWATDFQDKFAE